MYNVKRQKLLVIGDCFCFLMQIKNNYFIIHTSMVSFPWNSTVYSIQMTKLTYYFYFHKVAFIFLLCFPFIFFTNQKLGTSCGTDKQQGGLEGQYSSAYLGAVHKWRHPFFDIFYPSLPLSPILLNSPME